ncbi:histidinol phosphate aminotransferase [Aestuariicoccus sp. MJ-SS9]|uniref:histidinol phosphate aminotransferase n=1 Tax=Aestuariicoccus sp. MJ-SS9 TaxID=3079855 RepID=UPI00290DF711|nr:histidinol phosphate aminotransferase [Aestuariicoccus sp. MJ-SS9]MDU8912810.1 histidinol phosphate aminotransferase [Aestuariicoccus sp. MJ-SS9]
MDRHFPGRVEDYTTASLVLIFVNLLWILGVIWAQWGIGAVMLAGAVLNHLITRLEVYRARRAVESIRRGRNYEEA